MDIRTIEIVNLCNKKPKCLAIMPYFFCNRRGRHESSEKVKKKKRKNNRTQKRNETNKSAKKAHGLLVTDFLMCVVPLLNIIWF